MFYLFLVWHCWVTTLPLTRSAASLDRKEAIVGGREHTLVTKLPINLSFWEAAPTCACSTFAQHFSILQSKEKNVDRQQVNSLKIEETTQTGEQVRKRYAKIVWLSWLVCWVIAYLTDNAVITKSCTMCFKMCFENELKCSYKFSDKLAGLVWVLTKKEDTEEVIAIKLYLTDTYILESSNKTKKTVLHFSNLLL